MRVIATDEDAGKRLDVFLAERADCSRAHAAKWIEESRVTPAGKAGRRVVSGEVYEVDVPAARPLELVAEDIPLDILYEDGDLLVLNKPAGLVVHPAAGNETGTLVQALLHHCTDLSGINGVIRPGIVHRLDKDTSGALVVAKNDAAHLRLQEEIQSREMARTYWALVRGRVKADEGRIEGRIGRDPRDRKRMAVTQDGRPAATRYRVLDRMAASTLVECKLETGRTHQIRVHMRHLGHPVLGDPVYGTKEEGASRGAGAGQMLHAVRLELTHPRTGVRMRFLAMPPEAFWRRLRREGGDVEAARGRLAEED